MATLPLRLDNGACRVERAARPMMLWCGPGHGLGLKDAACGSSNGNSGSSSSGSNDNLDVLWEPVPLRPSVNLMAVTKC